MTTNSRICKTCGRPTKLMLPPGGDGPRQHQCLECDRPDPLHSPSAKWAESPLAKSTEMKKSRLTEL